MTGRQMYRPPAVLPVQAMQSYQIVSPRSTHTRPATCEEVDCSAWRHGWRTVVDEATGLGRRQAAWIRSSCVPDSLRASPAATGRRRYVEDRTGALTAFTFPAGQTCFGEHRVSLDRPELFVVRDGDWRGNPTGRVRRHERAEDWVEDFATHQQAIADRRQKG